ncbi:MAG: hypothetical protein COA43_12990 [Robiginitomaculum sp.]|nr:MAG: hypothetical protein COA43_12990 [Robiginitomaculum sp.]
MPKRIRRVFPLAAKIASDEKGVTSIEYALIAAVISVVGIGAFSHVSKNTQATFARIENALAGNVTTETIIVMNEANSENELKKTPEKVKKKKSVKNNP